MEVVDQYLNSYAEPGVSRSSKWTRGLADQNRYDHILVVPAFDETIDDIESIWEAIDERFLAVLVINSSAHHAATRKLYEDLLGTGSAAKTTFGHFIDRNRSPDLMLVDHTSSDFIPSSKGVGLARKIGCDLAVKLISEQVVVSSWVHTTDADAILPADYFQTTAELSPDVQAAVYPYQHTVEPPLELGIELYEFQMRSYVEGLKWADSTYAFPTLGSLIACKADTYCGVRGFPQRSAAEDFYFLNKVSKLTSIKTLTCHPVLLRGRLSDRVPVGTGPSLTKLQAMQNPLIEYQLPHPDCFGLLQEFLSFVHHLAKVQPLAITHENERVVSLMSRTGLGDQYLNKRRQSPKSEVLVKHMQDWFDGLKTRQFIHAARDEYFGTVNVEAYLQAPFSGPLRNFVNDSRVLKDALPSQMH